jgi:uncharacterized SAM-binding protein YcdF (DUF218 family)
MIVLKKVISAVVSPVVLLCLLLAAGVLLLWRDRGAASDNPSARRLLLAALLVLWILGSTLCGDVLLWPLLRDHPSLDVTELKKQRGATWSPDFIVVLAAGQEPDPSLPPSLRLTERCLARVNLAFYLHQQFPKSVIVCTGGRFRSDTAPVSQDMAATLQAWGVNRGMILTEEKSENTADHVRYLDELLRGRSFLLVTSSTHMRRAAALFRHAGLAPIAAPAIDYHLTVENWQDWWRGTIPNGRSFRRIEDAVHEHQGLLWAKLRGDA